MTKNFLELKIDENTVKLLAQKGIKQPTEVQDKVVPIALTGRDILVQAQTGTGKTLSFLLPLLASVKSEVPYLQALIVAPTRELSLQIYKEAQFLAAIKNINVAQVCGGLDKRSQEGKLKKDAQIVIGTPGRLLDHLRNKTINLGAVKFFVLDEVDEMLRRGFLEDISMLVQLLPAKRQSVMCSATLPDSVKSLAKQILTNPWVATLSEDNITVDNIRQIGIKVAEEKKKALLSDLLKRLNPYLAMVFCISKDVVKEVEKYLIAAGYKVEAIHGELSQSKRNQVMKKFQEAKIQVLVASELVARGMDIQGVTHVINYDIPHNANMYVHRIGRTGRAQSDGVAVTLYTPDDIKWLVAIEKALGYKMEKQNHSGDTLSSRPKTSGDGKRGRSALGDKRGKKNVVRKNTVSSRNQNKK